MGPGGSGPPVIHDSLGPPESTSWTASTNFAMPQLRTNVESAPFLTLSLPRGTLYRKTCVLFLTLCLLGSDLVSDIAIFVLKRDVKLQLTNFRKRLQTHLFSLAFNVCWLLLPCYVMLCNPYVNDIVLHLCSACNRRTINFYMMMMMMMMIGSTSFEGLVVATDRSTDQQTDTDRSCNF